MKLTEQQKEIALRAVDLVLSNLADRSFDVRVCDEDVVEDIRQSLAIDIATIYTKAPIAPPASGQKPVAYRHLHEDGWEYYDAPTGDDCSKCQPLYTAPQPDYKAQRDAERYRLLRDDWWFCGGHENIRKALCPDELDAEVDAAIASVKGGA